jgi:hypothetical protein
MRVKRRRMIRMKLRKIDLIWIAAVVLCVAVPWALLSSARPAMVAPDDDYIHFECDKHNQTQKIMEPSTRYLCFANQTCYAFTDANCNGLFVVIQMHPDMCEESVAYIGNTTIICNGTVADCEYLHNRRR